MSDSAIKVRNLGKKYKVGKRIRYNTLREKIAYSTSISYRKLISVLSGQPVEQRNLLNPISGEQASKSSNYFWSLNDVSFDVARGEIVGIIGRNGAGKSTLLKIIAGITEPTVGRIDIYGRIGSLLEVGTGFHPELTGRENIFLNGAILGMKNREIESKFDEIVDFAGIEQFVDTPVKFYSSGMRVRLGFSVAAHLEPEILLLDEVLAVGDSAFQKKCLGKLDNIAASEGRTVLFISHDLAAVQSICNRTILLKDGAIAAEGPTERIIDEYLGSINITETIPLAERKDIYKSSEQNVIATFLSIENLACGKPIRPSSQVIFKIGYRSKNPVSNLIVQLQIKDYKTNQPITYLDSDNSPGIPTKVPAEGTITCITNKIFITSGGCSVDLIFYKGTELVYKLENAGFFTVEGEMVFSNWNITRNYAAYLLEHTWLFENAQ